MSELPKPTKNHSLDDTADLSIPHLTQTDYARGDVADHANLVAKQRDEHERCIERAEARIKELKALKFDEDTGQGTVTLTAEDSRKLNEILRGETPAHEASGPSNTPPHPVLRKIFMLSFMKRLLVGRHDHALGHRTDL